MACAKKAAFDEAVSRYMLPASVIRVVEFFGVSGGIQYIFISQWAYTEDNLIASKIFWVWARKIRAYFY